MWLYQVRVVPHVWFTTLQTGLPLNARCPYLLLPRPSRMIPVAKIEGQGGGYQCVPLRRRVFSTCIKGVRALRKVAQDLSHQYPHTSHPRITLSPYITHITTLTSYLHVIPSHHTHHNTHITRPHPSHHIHHTHTLTHILFHTPHTT